MCKIAEMRQKRGELWDRAKAFLNEHADENGMMSAEDTATYERMEQELDNFGAAIDRQERAERLERELNAPTSEALTSRPEKNVPGKQGRASDEYRDAFWRMVRDRSDSYTVYNALQIGTDSEGGYLCPDEYERTLIQALEEENKLRSLCKVIRTASGDRKIPLVASHGTASWVDEEGVIPESDDSFGQITLGAHKVASIIKVSDELLHDSVFDVASYIAREFARRIGAAEEEAFFTGDGTGKPLGILAATGGAQTGVTAASATAITMDEVIDLFYSLRAPYRKRAAFVVNDATDKAIRKLKNGNGDYLWQPSLTVGAPDMLLGRPVYTSAYMPTIGAGAKTILFGDLGYYWVADREGRSFKRLNELYAATGQVGFLASERVDGKLILPEAVKVLAQKSA